MMRMIIVSVSLFISIEINQSNAKTNISECFGSYCYFWNGVTAHYNQLEQCPEPFWDLEIYDEQVEAEVFKFVELVIDNNFGIQGYFVPLNLSCQNLTTCTWKHKNQPAAHLNWEQGVKWVDKDDVIYFRARKFDESKQWDRFDKNIKHAYAKLCMKENFDRSKKTDAITTKHAKVITNSSSYGSESNNTIIILLAVVGIIVVVLIVIVVVVAVRKRTGSGISSSSNKCKPSNNAPANNNIVQQSSGECDKTIYAEIPNTGSENICNINQPSMQYADLKWSENILQVQQNISKPIEDQTINYCGPMGDVYARVQKI